MGGRGKSRTQRKHFKQQRENVWKRTKLDPSADNSKNDENNNNNKAGWEPVVPQNSAFEHYYKGQAIVVPEEWDAFMDTLRKPLPAAFRINASSQFSSDIRSQLENDFMKSLQAEVTDNDEVEAIRPLPWYPDNLAWHLNFSRNQLRKNQTLERFHEFLKLENEVGSLTRQEAVSMVPPLFLDVHPNQFVLDMCAAPGSKTFQLLEIIHQSSEPGSLPGGLVVANDLDVQRCNLLIHQTKRMCTANLIVTNHEAQQFPGCRSKHGNRTSEQESGGPLNISQLLFDRVLCDVPCSGDGTLRKAPDIWRKWNPGMGNGVHSLQVQIAMRGLSLLKVGGKMVYSTCSMNPVENEAVVAEILRKCGESVELLDVSGELPQLVRRPGIKKWKVYDKGAWLASYKDVSKYRRNAIIPSMFPSGSSLVEDESNPSKLENEGNGKPEDCPEQMGDIMDQASGIDEEVSDQPLDRCMRIMPHDQNTGAFFIAVLHKRSPLPAVQESTISQQGILKNDESCEEKVDQTMDDSNAPEAVTGDCADDKLPEAASDAGDVLNENEVAVALEADPSGASTEQNSEGAKENADAKPAPLKVTGKRKLQMQGKWRGVDPVILFQDENTINSIKAFYGIKDSFPFRGHLVTRNNDTNSVKRIYYISESVKDILELNTRGGQQLKIASVGLKMFERQTSKEAKAAPCSFRISSEGLPLILPYITKQILPVSLTDFKHLLQYKSIKFSDFSDPDFGEKASKLSPGCCVLVLGKGSKASSDPISVDNSTVAFGCWKGRASLNVLVPAMDCQELLERLSVSTEYEVPSLPEITISSEIEANQVQITEPALEN